MGVSHKGKCIAEKDCPCCEDAGVNYKCGDVWISKKDDCIRNKCNAKCVIEPEPVVCDMTQPTEPVCIPGSTYKCVDRVISAPCCVDKTIYKCCPCKPCDDCPILAQPKCRKCEKLELVYDQCNDETKCTCPKEYKCVLNEDYNPCTQDCPSCRPESLTIDEEGCPIVKCLDM